MPTLIFAIGLMPEDVHQDDIKSLGVEQVSGTKCIGSLLVTPDYKAVTLPITPFVVNNRFQIPIMYMTGSLDELKEHGDSISLLIESMEEMQVSKPKRIPVKSVD